MFFSVLLEISHGNNAVIAFQCDQAVVKADDAAGAAFDLGNLAEQLECRYVTLLRVGVFFDFERIESSVFLDQKVNLVHVLVAVEIERRFQNSLVVIALDDFGNHETLKKSSRHGSIFQDLRGSPFCQVRSESRVEEIQFGRFHSSPDDVVRVGL